MEFEFKAKGKDVPGSLVSATSDTGVDLGLHIYNKVCAS